MSKVKTIDDLSFTDEVLRADTPVMVDFTATWCGPCEALGPILDEIAAERDDIKIVKIYVGGTDSQSESENPVTKDAFGIDVFPTMLMFRDGKIADALFGGMDNKAPYLKWIDAALAKDPANDAPASDGASYVKGKLEALFEQMRQKKAQAEQEKNDPDNACDGDSCALPPRKPDGPQ